MIEQHLVKSEWRVSAGTLSFSCSETGQLVTSPLPDHDGVGKVVHGMNTDTSKRAMKEALQKEKKCSSCFMSVITVPPCPLHFRCCAFRILQAADLREHILI